MGVLDRQLMAAGSLVLALAFPGFGVAQTTRTTCADCLTYQGAYSIENTTGVTIAYSFRWGKDNPWKQNRLDSGKVTTHNYPLGENRSGKAPTPYVRFDRIGGDSAYTPKEYRMEFFAVAQPPGAPRNATEPKRYVFKYSPDGRSLDIKGK